MAIFEILILSLLTIVINPVTLIFFIAFFYKNKSVQCNNNNKKADYRDECVNGKVFNGNCTATNVNIKSKYLKYFRIKIKPYKAKIVNNNKYSAQRQNKIIMVYFNIFPVCKHSDNCVIQKNLNNTYCNCENNSIKQRISIKILHADKKDSVYNRKCNRKKNKHIFLSL